MTDRRRERTPARKSDEHPERGELGRTRQRGRDRNRNRLAPWSRGDDGGLEPRIALAGGILPGAEIAPVAANALDPAIAPGLEHTAATATATKTKTEAANANAETVAALPTERAIASDAETEAPVPVVGPIAPGNPDQTDGSESDSWIWMTTTTNTGRGPGSGPRAGAGAGPATPAPRPRIGMTPERPVVIEEWLAQRRENAEARRERVQEHREIRLARLAERGITPRLTGSQEFDRNALRVYGAPGGRASAAVIDSNPDATPRRPVKVDNDSAIEKFGKNVEKFYRDMWKGITRIFS